MNSRNTSLPCQRRKIKLLTKYLIENYYTPLHFYLFQCPLMVLVYIFNLDTLGIVRYRVHLYLVLNDLM
jgi:hypothetical protein